MFAVNATRIQCYKNTMLQQDNHEPLLGYVLENDEKKKNSGW